MGSSGGGMLKMKYKEKLCNSSRVFLRTEESSRRAHENKGSATSLLLWLSVSRGECYWANQWGERERGGLMRNSKVKVKQRSGKTKRMFQLWLSDTHLTDQFTELPSEGGTEYEILWSEHRKGVWGLGKMNLFLSALWSPPEKPQDLPDTTISRNIIFHSFSSSHSHLYLLRDWCQLIAANKLATESSMMII